jgi:hypothetical protein
VRITAGPFDLAPGRQSETRDRLGDRIGRCLPHHLTALILVCS